jgi:hypothetical protein
LNFARCNAQESPFPHPTPPGLLGMCGKGSFYLPSPLPPNIAPPRGLSPQVCHSASVTLAKAFPFLSLSVHSCRTGGEGGGGVVVIMEFARCLSRSKEKVRASLARSPPAVCP